MPVESFLGVLTTHAGVNQSASVRFMLEVEEVMRLDTISEGYLYRIPFLQIH